MKFLHVIPYHRAMTPMVLSFYEQYFDGVHHEFLILNPPSDFCPASWSISIQTMSKRRNHYKDDYRFISRIKQAQTVVLHSLGIIDSLSQALILEDLFGSSSVMIYLY